MAFLRISDRKIIDDTHDYYDIAFDHDDILTLVTSDSGMVNFWISDVRRVHHRRLHRLVVGLDIEWRPNFNRRRNPAATLQLCVGRRCLIFQLIHAPEIPQSLIDFLDDESFTFVGVGIDQDAQKLYDDYGLEVANTVDLRDLAARDQMERTDLRNAGLKQLAREVLGREIEKPRNVTLSTWDDECLSPDQVLYATIDAFLSFEIGRYLSR